MRRVSMLWVCLAAGLLTALPGAAEAVILGGAARVVEGDGLQADGAAAGDRRAGAGACVRHDGERAVRAGTH